MEWEGSLHEAVACAVVACAVRVAVAATHPLVADRFVASTPVKPGWPASNYLGSKAAMSEEEAKENSWRSNGNTLSRGRTNWHIIQLRALVTRLPIVAVRIIMYHSSLIY